MASSGLTKAKVSLGKRDVQLTLGQSVLNDRRKNLGLRRSVRADRGSAVERSPLSNTSKALRTGTRKGVTYKAKPLRKWERAAKGMKVSRKDKARITGSDRRGRAMPKPKTKFKVFGR